MKFVIVPTEGLEGIDMIEFKEEPRATKKQEVYGYEQYQYRAVEVRRTTTTPTSPTHF